MPALYSASPLRLFFYIVSGVFMFATLAVTARGRHLMGKGGAPSMSAMPMADAPAGHPAGA